MWAFTRCWVPLWRSEPRHRLLVVGVVVAQRVRSFGLGREEGGSSIAARHSEAGGGGAGEDCCDSFILHRNRGRQPAAENDEQTLAAVLLFYVRQALSIIAERLLRQCPSYRLPFRRLIVSSSPLRPGKSSLMSVLSRRGWSASSSYSSLHSAPYFPAQPGYISC